MIEFGMAPLCAFIEREFKLGAVKWIFGVGPRQMFPNPPDRRE